MPFQLTKNGVIKSYIGSLWFLQKKKEKTNKKKPKKTFFSIVLQKKWVKVLGHKSVIFV